MPVLFVIGSIFVVAGVGVLRFSWGKKARDRQLNLLGWGLLSASLYFWAQFGQPDWGIPVGVIVFILTALGFILYAMLEKQPEKVKREKQGKYQADGTSTPVN